MDSEKKLFLLDAFALIFRSYYAFISNPMRNSKGKNTSTAFGFTITLDDVLKNQNPSHIAVAFDPSGPTFRNDLFPAYKANRQETPEDIKAAVPYIKKIVEAYNIPVIESAGYEADDVIGTLAKQAEKEGFKVYMMTPDKDYNQLVSENIVLFKPRKSGNDSEIIDSNAICSKFGIQDPAQFIDILALWGDSSDNIPGVPGIGEKTAIKLISEFGSLDNVYNNLDKFKGKQLENLVNFKEQAYLSKDLVTIRLDVPVTFHAETYIKEPSNPEKLREIFEELEFKTLLNRIPGREASSPAQTQTSTESPGQGNLFSGFSQETPSHSTFDNLSSIPKNYSLLNDEKSIQNLSMLLNEAKAFSFDTETTDLDIFAANIVGISFSMKAHEGFYIPLSQNYDEAVKRLSLLKKPLENKSILKVAQNLKFDMRILKKYGIEVAGELFDTMIAHYLLRPEQKHNLNILSENYLNYSPVKIEELIGEKGRNQGNMKDVALDKIADYAAEDADLAFQLYEKFSPELDKEGLTELSEKIEMPLIGVLAEMEHNGIKLDIPSLEEFRIELVKDILESEEKIFRLAGTDFNIQSPKQLGEILFDRLKIDPDAKKTKTKQYSTSEDVLVRLTDKHEIVSEVLTYRGLKKLLSTYVDALPKLIEPTTGKIHTSFNQTVAATGRLSSNNPNLQNIPIREERGREIRKSFIPDNPENIFLSADYSQIELRLMAHLSKDENMIEAFLQGEDIHTATAAKIYKTEVANVSREMRSRAKTANFGIIYGISAFGLAQRLNISRTDAKELIDNYFETFPGVKAYMDTSIKMARDAGHVVTMLGRKRYLPDINSRNQTLRGMAERNAINAPIQGSAADIIKIAMIELNRKIKEAGMASKMILQVHDELVFDMKVSEQADLLKMVKTEMENAIKLSVPLIVDMGTGSNWFEAH
ncbi:MAG: DNA polymerase I [Bacteroidales bacterium]|nr:DNA polymerase I [Bacteroidales bacterium]MCB8999805.1 DNA polymerase I [Bacteroidales bacterium]